jgi:recombination protein RecA
MTKKTEEIEAEEKDDILERVNKEIEKEFGKGLVRPAKMLKDEDYFYISSGSLRLNIALHRPLKEGTIMELSGQEGGGKTTLALEFALNAILAGRSVIYFNLEANLSESLVNSITSIDGAKINRDKMFIVDADDAEQALNIAERYIREVPKCFLVVDSVAALSPLVEQEKEMQEQSMGLQGKMLSLFLRKVSVMVAKQRSNILFVNQMRDSLKPYGKSETTPGGRALPYWCYQRVELRPNEKIKDSQGTVVGHQLRCVVSKNKGGMPYLSAMIPLIYGQGIQKHLELAELAIELGLIQKSGSWIVIGAEKIQGIPQLCEYLKQNPKVAHDLISRIKDLYK